MAEAPPTLPAPANQLPPDPADEPALARQARHDQHAFGELYDRYVHRIYAYCYRRLGTHEAAEDATALVFFRALQAIAAYRDDGPSFRAWIFAIAHNAVVDDLRTRRWHGGLVDTAASQVAASGPDPEAAAIAAEDRAQVRHLLTALPPSRAHVVELRLAGLNDQEIAAVTGRSHGAVRVTMHRALAQLRRLLHPEEAPRV